MSSLAAYTMFKGIHLLTFPTSKPRSPKLGFMVELLRQSRKLLTHWDLHCWHSDRTASRSAFHLAYGQKVRLPHANPLRLCNHACRHRSSSICDNHRPICGRTCDIGVWEQYPTMRQSYPHLRACIPRSSSENHGYYEQYRFHRFHSWCLDHVRHVLSAAERMVLETPIAPASCLVNLPNHHDYLRTRVSPLARR